MRMISHSFFLFLLVLTVLGCDNISSLWNKSKIETKKSRFEQVKEKARANLTLPVFTEIPNMRGVSEAEKDFQNSPHYFTLDMIEVFKYVWDADEIQTQLSSKSDAEVNEQSYKVFLEKIRLLRSAQSVLKPYSNSENKMIKAAAELAKGAISQQLVYNLDTLAFLKYLNTYIPETEKDINEGYRVMEEMKYEVRRIRAEYDGTYRLLMSVVVMMAQILVDQEPDENGNLSRLVITTEQKNNIIAAMYKNFKQIPPFVTGQKLDTAPVSSFYHWITTSEHTPKNL